MKIAKDIFVKIRNDSGVLSNFICSVQLLVYKKNDFSIGFFKTDENGEFIIKKSLIKKLIKTETFNFPMDYNDNIKNFNGEIKFLIESQMDLQNRLNRIIEFYPENSELMNLNIGSSSNKLISNSLELIVKVEQYIVLSI